MVAAGSVLDVSMIWKMAGADERDYGDAKHRCTDCAFKRSVSGYAQL